MAKLYFRYGAMNSGKSTALMQVAHNYEEQGMQVLILKPQVDTKGGDELDEYDFGEDEDADEEPAEIEIHSENGQEDET